MTVSLKLGLMAAATVLGLLYLLLTATAGKYRQLVDADTSKAAFLAGAGFRALELVRFDYESRAARKKAQTYSVVFGEQFGDYYFRITLAKQVSAVWLVLVFALLVAVLAEEPIVLLVGAVLALACGYYLGKSVKERSEARAESIERDYPELLSKLALLVNAGLITRKAWEKIAFMGKGELYREMRVSIEEMRNGVSEQEAYLSFARRCNNDNVTRFISTLIQNLNKGDDELAAYLSQYAGEAWNLRKQTALQKGQQASSKLLIPIVMIFLGIMLMIVVPVFQGIGL